MISQLGKFVLIICLLGCTTAVFAQQSVKGVVTSGDSALSAVTVTVKGTAVATTTDDYGKFRINAGPTDILVFSSVGFIAREIPVGGHKNIDVRLTSEAESLSQVVVVGYGTTKKATLTGAVVSVKGADLAKSPATNLSNSLAGRIPGLTAVTRSGEPGNDGSTLLIRGSNTLNDNTPLVVVDGVPGRQLERIDPSDIESVTVLKDASAAIYGARAANGVIMVTTKRGNSGKPTMNLSYDQGFVSPSVIPKMADAATWAKMVNEIKEYRSMDPVYSEEDIQKYQDGSDPWGHPNTDWFKAVYKPVSVQRNAHVSLRGGNESVHYLLSAGYRFQDGIYRNSATNYSQGNFRANLDAKVNSNIKVSFDLSGRQENRNYPTQSSDNIYSSTMRGKPNIAARWPNGLPGPDIERGANPVVMATSATGYDKDIRYVLESNTKLDINIPWVKGLSVTSNASIDKFVDNHKLWQTPWYLYYWDGQSYNANNEPQLTKSLRGYATPQLSQDFNNGNRTTLNGLINYRTTIAGVHNIKALVGMERITGDSMNFYAARRNYISSAADQLFAGGDGLNQTNGGGASVNARLDYFGRLNYNYKEKYLAEFVFRYDGSYIFPSGSNQFGFFPGVSLGYVISEEDFWKKNVRVINNLKIRGSWGQTGNDRIDPYQYLQGYAYAGDGSTPTTYVFNVNEENKAINEIRIANPNVTWEIANQSNIGVDGQLLDGKVFFSMDYFYNLRTNILAYRNASVPSSTGLTLPRQNIGKVVNQGFEFQVGTTGKVGQLTYTVSVNGGYQKNKIKFWDEVPGAPAYQLSTGHPMNTTLYYEAVGIFRDQDAIDKYPHWANAKPGDIIFRDVNKDGQINGLDQVRNDKNDVPTFTGGISIDLQYKNFYATVLLQGASGAIRKQFTFSGESGNYLQADAIGRWTPTNIDASKPRAWNFADEYWMTQYDVNNTYFLRNNNYLRLKNIEFGYNFPAPFLTRAGIKGLRTYVSGLNLATVTKLKNYDPESNSDNPYPSNKVVNVGLNLTF
ncbi:SusC/RagA family TonB-linked outer membrane protein [Flavitalea flava]